MTPDPPFDHDARRRALLNQAMQDPADLEARQRLAAHVVEAAKRPAYPGGIGFLAVVGALCAILAVVALLGGLDVTAALLAAAGIYTVVMIRRRS